MKDFRKQKVWEKSHKLTLKVYLISKKFPKDELFGLTSQIRRSSASISANIAEGCGRSGEIELARFLHIALGSASESDYHLMLACDLGYLTDTIYQELYKEVSEIKKMLVSFIKKLKAKS